MDYEQHYDLLTRLQAEARLIEADDLYNFDDGVTYAAQMDRLAQPLPNGEESPFSSRSPTSAHAIFVARLIHQQKLIAHQFNLTKDRTWVQHFRMLGVELQPAEYPVINIVFRRTTAAVLNNMPVEIPLNTEIRSRIDPSLAVYTLYTARIEGADETVTVPARLNQLGALPNVRRGEFSDIPRLLSFVESAENDGTIVSVGRPAETLVDAMLRAREGLRSGSLGRSTINGTFDPENIDFQARCVTDRDYYYWASRLGAEKVNVLKGIQYGAEGVFRDLVTVAVYPADIRDLIYSLMLPMSLDRFDVIPAEVIPIDGKIQVRVTPQFADFQVFNLVAGAIASTVNPPYGTWGDRNFPATLATALEQTNGIYATPLIQLKHAITGQPLSELDIQPWHLLEIQSSLEIEALR